MGMNIILKLAVVVLFLFCSMSLSARESGVLHKVVVESLLLSQMGMLVGNPKMVFGIVNLDKGKCFSVSPPWGVRLIHGDSYTFREDDDIDGDIDNYIRKNLDILYPGCALVKVVD
jgi:hypothetical protein